MQTKTYKMFGYAMKLTKMRDSCNRPIVRIQLFNRAGKELFVNYLALITTEGYSNDEDILNNTDFIYDCWSRVATIHDDQWEDVYEEFDQITKKFIESAYYRMIGQKVNEYFK